MSLVYYISAVINAELLSHFLCLYINEWALTNRSITSKIANPDSLIHNTMLKLISKLIPLIDNSSFHKLNQLSEVLNNIKNISEEYNLTSYDYANLTDTILAPALVYDSTLHPSSVTIPITDVTKK